MLLRVLEPGDEPLLEAFLLPRIASSMILLSNCRNAGLHDLGERWQGTYLGAFADGELIGVVGHFWNCNAILQAPSELAAELCEAAMRASGRPLRGLLGPSAQVRAVVDALGSSAASPQLDSLETLFGLKLSALQVPVPLAHAQLQVRVGCAEDLPVLAQWRAAFCVESLHERDTPELHVRARDDAAHAVERGQVWLAFAAGQPVATSGWNAATPEAVQIGGVYTPPALRGRGYARCAVAQSLLDARARGVASSSLFTGDDNLPAQRAYLALGYERVGDYRIVLL